MHSKSLNQWLVIVIIHGKYTFSADNGIWQAWIKTKDTYLQFKRHGQGIMTLNYFFLFSRLNLLSLSLKKQVEVIKKLDFISEYFWI